MDYKADFLEFLQYHRNLAENTLHSYEFDLREFLQWINQRELRPEDVKIKEIDAFLISRRKGGNSIQTVNQKMYCLKTFYKWLLRMEIIDRSPLDVFENIKSPRLLPKYLTQEEQEALLKAAKIGNHTEPWINRRNYLLLLFMLDTGLRVSEVCGLQMKDVSVSEQVFKVMGKGSKEREMVLSDRVRKAVADYLKSLERIKFKGGVGPGLASRGLNMTIVAKEMGISPKAAIGAVKCSKGIIKKIQAYVKKEMEPRPIQFLFFNKHGKPMITRHLFRIVKELGYKAGINGLHPHSLRHTFATNLRRKGADLFLMREALGHSSVNTTQIYAHLGNDEYKNQLRSFINQS